MRRQLDPLRRSSWANVSDNAGNFTHATARGRGHGHGCGCVYARVCGQVRAVAQRSPVHPAVAPARATRCKSCVRLRSIRAPGHLHASSEHERMPACAITRSQIARSRASDIERLADGHDESGW
ncbi:hypothetical protein A8H31_03505 [Burkholderia thailandensis]|nr:hypothetical protein A8H31_03505 [Burkholderia thailandensis]